MTVSDAEILTALELNGSTARIASDGGLDLDAVPTLWQPIVSATDADTRASIALSLWTPEFLQFLPEFAHIMRTELADARVITIDDEPLLAYVVEHIRPDHRVVAVWLGTPPGGMDTTPARPELAAAIPPAVRGFMAEVHGRFTAPDLTNFGFGPIDAMVTLAQIWQLNADLPGWPPPAPDRLLVLMSTSTDLRVCVSPDLPSGICEVIYRSDDPDPPQSVSEALDEVLLDRFDVEW